MAGENKTAQPKPVKLPRMTGGAGSGVGRAQKSHVPLVRKAGK